VDRRVAVAAGILAGESRVADDIDQGVDDLVALPAEKRLFGARRHAVAGIEQLVEGVLEFGVVYVGHGPGGGLGVEVRWGHTTERRDWKGRTRPAVILSIASARPPTLPKCI